MRPNSGEVQESAEREALAKVIKHKGKDRQLDKTVIIKNTPEAFRFAFPIYIGQYRSYHSSQPLKVKVLKSKLI